MTDLAAPGRELLLPGDAAYLESKAYEYRVSQDRGFICIEIFGYQLPAGLQPEKVDLLIRLPGMFPRAAPDMFWIFPVVSNPERQIPAADGREELLGRTWQRWSRHLEAGQWRGDRDDLETWLVAIRKSLMEAAA